MSDDKKQADSSKDDGSGSDSGTTNTATTMGFGELLGHIDSRIESLLSKRGKSDSGNSKDTGAPGTADPQSVREQLRAELAKLQGEEAAAKKDADRDVTIQELKDQIAKITETAPVENVSKLTAFMWGKKPKQ
jgi:hypothetical protein